MFKKIVAGMQMNSALTYIILFILFIIWSGCAPYSLPEKKTYSEKDNPYIYYAQGAEAYEARDYMLALQNIDIALRLNNNLAQFYQLKGDIHKALSENDKAIEAYQTAIKKRSNFVEVYMSLAELYEQLKNYKEAIRYYKRASGLQPEQIEILLKIVNCYIQLNEMAVADHNLNTYEKDAAEFKKPISDRYYVLRGEVLYLTKEYIQSLNLLDKVSEPDSLTLYLYGKNYYELEDFDKGVTYFNKLLNGDKNNGSWYYYRGIYFFEQKDFKDAKGQFEYALELDSTLYEPHYYLGKIYLEENDQESALREFESFLQNEVDSQKAEEVNTIIQSLKPKSD
jgi:tetratricopeptide (TPR) repeat protein